MGHTTRGLGMEFTNAHPDYNQKVGDLSLANSGSQTIGVAFYTQHTLGLSPKAVSAVKLA